MFDGLWIVPVTLLVIVHASVAGGVLFAHWSDPESVVIESGHTWSYLRTYCWCCIACYVLFLAFIIVDTTVKG